MGIQDRHYYHRDDGARRRVAFALRSSPSLSIIVITVLVWVVQIVGGEAVTRALSASAETVLERLQLWRLLTACFAHSPESLWHLAFNMLFLYWAGRELEQLYEARDLYTLYLVSGIVSILAEILILAYAGGRPGAGFLAQRQVLGASGAVMALFVLFATFYPTRTIHVFGIVPAPIWLLCVIYIGSDLLAALGGPGRGVANTAHLAGALLGWLYRAVDPRWTRLLPSRRGVARYPLRARRRPERTFEVIQFPAGRASAPPPEGKPAAAPRKEGAPQDGVSRRIDELLAKISSSGKESLTEDEWEFLRDNSSRYRSS